ncbi:MAG: cell division protein FtsZ [Robiginitomaculum sp.]|nr:cell division protein FtsZ [Robiginitomaculum sp.]
MSIKISLPKAPELKPRIAVIGVGGAGGNAVNNMINSGLDGIEFLVANTDAQSLALSKTERRIQMGGAITQGLGAGMRPEVGEEAAESSLQEIMEHLDDTNMLFVAAGMGGGTGTGAAPVIAKAARERGILTVAIVTKPFQFEGSKRMALAEAGIETLYNCVDTLIVIPNQNLFRIATESTTMADAFAMADEVLNSGVRGITDLMVVPGLINLDFADVRTVMGEMGKAMMGTGEATGERRAIEAAESAIANPLLDDVSLKGAKGVLINITGGSDLTLYEVDEAASLIRGQVDPDANIIVGSALDKDLDGIVRISVVATGVDSNEIYAPLVADIETRAEPEEQVEVAQTSKRYSNTTGAENDFEPTYNETTDLPDDIAIEEVQSEIPEDRFVSRPKEPAPFTYTRPNIETPDAPTVSPTASLERETIASVETQTVVKRPFGFFGRKKTRPVAPITRPDLTSNKTGDLFGVDEDDELEIPSFLRRQNK